LTSKFHVKYLHIEGYIGRKEEATVSMNLLWSDRREELIRRERDLRRAAERARVVGPLRRARRRRRRTD